MSSKVAAARTLLFVPGNRHERFEKAADSAPDAIVLDLEDSVPVASKEDARASIEREWRRLKAFNIPLLIRVNASDTAAGKVDLSWLATLESPAAVMLPKVESAAAISSVHQVLKGLPVVPLIESAAGYASLFAVAQTQGVLRLAIGHLDFIADVEMQLDEEQTQLAPLRFAVTCASRVGRLAPAIDGVTEKIGDEQRLRRDVLRARSFGLGGKLCIHPAQISIAHEAFAPTPEEVAWARKVAAADAVAGGAAVQVDSRMVDLPVVLRARRILVQATNQLSASWHPVSST